LLEIEEEEEAKRATSSYGSGSQFKGGRAVTFSRKKSRRGFNFEWLQLIFYKPVVGG